MPCLVLEAKHTISHEEHGEAQGYKQVFCKLKTLFIIDILLLLHNYITFMPCIIDFLNTTNTVTHVVRKSVA